MSSRAQPAAKRQRTLQNFFTTISSASSQKVTLSSATQSQCHQFFSTNGVQLCIFEHCDFLDVQQFAELLRLTDPNFSFSASTFSPHQCLQFSASLIPSYTQSITTYILRRPLLEFTTNLNIHTAIEEFFNINTNTNSISTDARENCLQPLCIFAEAGPKGKGGKEPPHAQNKIAWDDLSKYSVTFLSTKDQKIIRIHVCRQKGIFVQDIIKFKYDIRDDGKVGACIITNLKQPWRSFNEAQKLTDSLQLTNELKFLLRSEDRITKGDLARMFNCGICRRPVGRSESAFHRHASDVHNLTITWRDFFACEHCLVVFFNLTLYKVHMEKH